MDSQSRRDLIRQTAEDFEWLEAHSRSRADLARHAGELRFAAALTRNVIGPAVEGIKPPPLHIAVIGGAGAGKSTAVNFLVGQVAAEANPQAGYTRHPTAFLPADRAWPTHLGFIGPLRRLDRDAPANLDEDVYQVHRTSPHTDCPLADFIIWDCPDMTAWASAGYVSRLAEIAALADVVIYVASDERYNDEIPTQYLNLMLRAGKAVVVLLTKMPEGIAATIGEHFRREVLEKVADAATRANIPIVTLPQLPVESRADPSGLGLPWRTALLNQIFVLCPSPAAARQRTTVNAASFLETAADNLLQVARADLAELDAWQHTVAEGRAGYEARYRNEYLAGEPFKHFERTRQEVLRLLELPGHTHSASAVMQTIRLPVEWLVRQFGLFIARPEPPNLPERTVLATALNAWLDQLQAEALKRAPQHPLWKQLSQHLQGGVKDEAHQRFEAMAAEFERREAGEIETAARALAEQLASEPSRLSAFRIAKFGLEIAAMAAAIWANFHFGYSFWNLLWLIPVAAYAAHAAVSAVVRFIVERQRRRARDRREALLAEHVTRPLAGWLNGVPLGGGSPVERLQAILQRVPAAIRALAGHLRGAGSA